jgi:hypothetical protein
MNKEFTMCPAVRKITDEIAADMRAKYETGEYTQAELGELFRVSVPTINKTVKGVKPAKRKYQHRNPKYAERNESIVTEYKAGATTRDLATKYEMTHQNVSLVLKKAGINPQDRYFSELASQKAERVARVEAEKAAKKAAKAEKVEELSKLWAGGATIEEFRAAAGLKSVGAAQVKVVHLRKKYGEGMFPKRAAFGMTAEKRAEAQAEKAEKAKELSRLWIDKADNEALAAVFGWKPDTVVRRVPKFREEFGEEMFPYRRKPKAVAEVVNAEGLEVSDEAVEALVSDEETAE